MAKAGRPTKYKEDETNQIALGYIDSCGENHIVLDRVVIKDGKVNEEQYVKKEIKLPTFEGLAMTLNVNRDTLYEWSENYPMFSDTLDKLRGKQAEMLIQNGLSGDYNSTIAKLILSANHGINERTENESLVKVVDETISKEEREALLSLLDDQTGT